MSTSIESRALTKFEAAKYLGISDRAMDRLAESGRLRPKDIGGCPRYLREDLERVCKNARNWVAASDSDGDDGEE